MQRDSFASQGASATAGNQGIPLCTLFSGDVVEANAPVRAAINARSDSADADRIARLEEEVAALRRDLAEVKDQVERFRRQFE